MIRKININSFGLLKTGIIGCTVFFLSFFWSCSYAEETLLPVMSITKTKVAPVIDGEIKEEEWKYASASTGFVDLSGNITEDDTIVYLTYDEENLYFAFKSTCTKNIKAGITERDGPISNDDAIEIFLQPDPDVYYQFVGNSIGAIFDCKVDKGSLIPSWDTNWRFKNQVKDSGETIGTILTFAKKIWTAEVAISFKELGVSAPDDVQNWRVNFCRDWNMEEKNDEVESGKRITRWTSWSAAYGGNFHETKGFGYLYFREEAPVIKVESWGDLIGGDINIKGNILNSTPKEVNLSSDILVSLSKTKKEIKRKGVPLNISPSKELPIEIKETVELSRSIPVDFVFTVTDSSKEILYKNKFTFTPLPGFRIVSTLIYSRGLLEIECDIKRLANLPSGFSALAEVYNTKDKRLVISVPFEGLSMENRTGTYPLDISKFVSGEYVIKAYIKDGENIIAQKNVEFIIQKPEWFGNQLGISDKVPIPWTPVGIKENSVSVLGREYQFNKFPFPSQITTKEKTILNSPVEFEVITDQGMVKWERSKMEYIDKTDTKVKIKTINNSELVKMEGKVEIEFDGFIRIDITLIPLKPVTIESLVLRVPLKKECALYMKGLGIVESANIYAGKWYAAGLYEVAEGKVFAHDMPNWFFSSKGWVWENNFMNSIWVGDDNGGLAVLFDSDRNWQTKKYVEVEDKIGTKEIRFNFIDSSYPLKESLDYTIVMQATPVKPLPKDPQRWHFGYVCGNMPPDEDMEAMCNYGMGVGLGYPQLIDSAPQTIKPFNDAQIKIFPAYFSHFTTVERPEFQMFGKEWETIPRYRLPFASDGTAATVCLRGSYTDFFLWGINKMIDAGIGGIYFDSPPILQCNSQYHGCGYIDKEGKRRISINLFEAREAYKRLYILFKTRDPRAFTFLHTMPVVPLASFVDGVTEGEEWSGVHKMFPDLNPDFFRFGFGCYQQYGIPFTFYPSSSVYKQGENVIPFTDYYSLTLIHNIYPTSWCETFYDLKLIWKIMDEWYTSSEWVPYWRSKDLVESFKKEVKVCVYRKDENKKYLILAGNPYEEEARGELRINFSNFNLKEGGTKVTDLLEKKEVDLKIDKIIVSIPKHGVKFFLLEER